MTTATYDPYYYQSNLWKARGQRALYGQALSVEEEQALAAGETMGAYQNTAAAYNTAIAQQQAATASASQALQAEAAKKQAQAATVGGYVQAGTAAISAAPALYKGYQAVSPYISSAYNALTGAASTAPALTTAGSTALPALSSYSGGASVGATSGYSLEGIPVVTSPGAIAGTSTATETALSQSTTLTGGTGELSYSATTPALTEGTTGTTAAGLGTVGYGLAGLGVAGGVYEISKGHPATGAAMIGTSIGSIIMPGIGTLVGGIIGDVVGQVSKMCYLTTACAEAMNLPDDCEELTVLRSFRDNYVSQEDVDEYYRIAPQIVSAIGNDKEKWQSLYSTLVRPCVNMIKAEDYDGAYSLYKTVTIDLKQKYLGGENNG